MFLLLTTPIIALGLSGAATTAPENPAARQHAVALVAQWQPFPSVCSEVLGDPRWLEEFLADDLLTIPEQMAHLDPAAGFGYDREHFAALIADAYMDRLEVACAPGGELMQ